MMNTNQKGIDSYRFDIDGLRAIAVISVFLFHLDSSLLPGGFLGVDIFFVISGYLITKIILREHYLQTFSFIHFYARRVRRIFPALFVVILLSTVVAIFLLSPETYVNYMKSARYASGQLANIFFSRKVSYFAEGFAGQPLLHTWSLGVEEQFYLFWPFLIWICFFIIKKQINSVKDEGLSCHENKDYSHSKGLQCQYKQQINGKIASVFIILAFFSFLACWHLAETNYNLAFYMFYTRAFEFCFGGLVAIKIRHRSTSQLTNNLIGFSGLTLLFYSLFFISEDCFGRSFLQVGILMPCIGTSLILLSGVNSTIVSRLLGSRLTVFVGRISYSLYLFHWPLIIYWKEFSVNHAINFFAALVIVIVALLLSTLSYFFIEQPARKFQISDRFTLAIALIVIILFATCFRFLEDSNTAPWRIAKYDDNNNYAFQRFDPDCNKKEENGILVYRCQKTERYGTPIIALVGDSHSPHYLRAVTTWAKKNGHNVKYLGVAGCPMLLGDVHIQSNLDERHEQQCNIGLPLLKTQIVDDPLVEVILIAQRFDLFFDGKGYGSTVRNVTFKDSHGTIVQDHTSYYKKQLSFTVEFIRETGKNVILLKQVPIFNNFEACHWQPLLKKLLAISRVCEYNQAFLSKWQEPSIHFIDTFAGEHRISVFDPALSMDSPIQNSVNIYRDQDHLNSHGSMFLVSKIGAFLDEQLPNFSQHTLIQRKKIR